MQHQNAPPSPAQRLKRWLLSQKHLQASNQSDRSAQAGAAWLHIGYPFFVAWALTRAPLLFSVNPLPLALLLATPRGTLPALIGILFGIWQGAPHPRLTLASALITLLVRYLIRMYAYPWGDEHARTRQDYRHAVRQRVLAVLRALTVGRASQESDDSPLLQMLLDSPATGQPLPVSLRTLAAAIGGCFAAIIHCVGGEFAFYHLYGAVIFLLLTPIACALFCFSLAERTAPTTPVRRILGHAAMLYAVCFCLRSLTFLALFPAIAVLVAFSLHLARKNGAAAAVGAALLGGLAIDTSILPPLLALVALYALLHHLAPRLCWIGATLAGLGVSLMGGEHFFIRLTPSLSIGILLGSVALAWERHAAQQPSETPTVYQHDAALASLRAEQQRTAHMHARVCGMSGAFGGLCEVLLRMGVSLRRQDLLERSSQEEGEHAERFAKDCSVMASLLQDILSEDARTLQADDQIAEKLGQALRRAGAEFQHVVCLTQKNRCRIELHGCDPAHLNISCDQLHRLAERVTERALRAPIYEGEGEAGGYFVLQARPTLSVQCTHLALAAGQACTPPLGNGQSGHEKKRVDCGDSIRFFSDSQNRFFALLCDGMGSGEGAAWTSGISVLFMERMLRAGVGMETALTLLNHYLVCRSGAMAETTCTVDLLSLDLFSGRARFIKSGAADTLILRDGQWYTVCCRSFPLGILSGVDVQIIPFALQAGDCILMMSDGVLDTDEFPDTPCASFTQDLPPSAALTPLSPVPWLYDILGNCAPEHELATRELLHRILCEARSRGSVDDMTVALLRVQEA